MPYVLVVQKDSTPFLHGAILALNLFGAKMSFCKASHFVEQNVEQGKQKHSNKQKNLLFETTS